MALSRNGWQPDRPIHFRLVHAVRGRARMRVDSPELADELGSALAAFFHEQPGIQEIRVNRDCHSVVLAYDPDLVTGDDLLALGQEPSNGRGAAWVLQTASDATTALAHAADRVRLSAEMLFHEARRLSSYASSWLPDFVKRIAPLR